MYGVLTFICLQFDMLGVDRNLLEVFCFFLPFGTWYLGCYDHLGNMFGSCIKHRGQAKPRNMASHIYLQSDTVRCCLSWLVYRGGWLPMEFLERNFARKNHATNVGIGSIKSVDFPYIYIYMDPIEINHSCI